MNSYEAQLSTVAIPAGRITLHGKLFVPPDARGLVLFAHGNGSSRHSPRDQRVAEFLHDVDVATLLFDLLSENEEPVAAFHARLRIDIALLASRLRTVTAWAQQQPELADLPIGYFGASHGAAAAMVAATGDGANISALVTRSGRPEFADEAISRLRVPTLLIVGANDENVAASNLEAWARLRCEKAIEIIPGAGHRFEEPGALDNVAALAARWFSEHLRRDADLAA